jgi:hypothetical protein
LWVGTLDRDDAHAFAERVIDLTIDVLRRQPHVSRRSYDDWTLLFADLRREIATELTKLIHGKVDFEEFVRALADTLAEEFA